MWQKVAKRLKYQMDSTRVEQKWKTDVAFEVNIEGE